jgi:histidine triad (HIT) family protein
MNVCLFCKIINKDIPCYNIYEDDIVLVFLDINPDTNGHMLIVPKKHYLDINDIDLEVLKHINKIARDMYQLLKDTFNVSGLTIAQNNGSAQEIKHYHMHLIPRYINDGMKHIYSDKGKLEVKEVHELLMQNKKR